MMKAAIENQSAWFSILPSGLRNNRGMANKLQRHPLNRRLYKDQIQHVIALKAVCVCSLGLFTPNGEMSLVVRIFASRAGEHTQIIDAL
jgi:hypothetical protein